MKERLLLAILIISVFMLIACGTSQTEDLSTPAPVPIEFAGKTNPLGAEAAAAGAEIFRNNCELCHGPQGHGDGAAGQSLDPKNLADLQTIVGDDYLFWRIYEGKPGTSMVAWKGILTDEQIWQAVAFIRTLR
jgi:mono/diheme cytochrome c family protein